MLNKNTDRQLRDRVNVLANQRPLGPFGGVDVIVACGRLEFIASYPLNNYTITQLFGVGRLTFCSVYGEWSLLLVLFFGGVCYKSEI
jgi:hypothetical protein